MFSDLLQTGTRFGHQVMSLALLDSKVDFHAASLGPIKSTVEKGKTNGTNVTMRADKLRTHLKIHIGEKSNKCNFVSSYARAFRTHLKLHSGEKQNKWNQCDFPSFGADGLRTHLKTHWRKLEPEQPMNSCNLFVFFLHKI